MKSNLAVALLATAIEAQNELQVALNLEQALQENFYAPVDRDTLLMQPGHNVEHYLPAGYAYPRNPHMYETPGHRFEEDHPYQYHPMFENAATEIDTADTNKTESKTQHAPSKMQFQSEDQQQHEPTKKAPHGKGSHQEQPQESEDNSGAQEQTNYFARSPYQSRFGPQQGRTQPAMMPQQPRNPYMNPQSFQGMPQRQQPPRPQPQPQQQLPTFVPQQAPQPRMPQPPQQLPPPQAPPAYRQPPMMSPSMSQAPMRQPPMGPIQVDPRTAQPMMRQPAGPMVPPPQPPLQQRRPGVGPMSQMPYQSQPQTQQTQHPPQRQQRPMPPPQQQYEPLRQQPPQPVPRQQQFQPVPQPPQPATSPQQRQSPQQHPQQQTQKKTQEQVESPLKQQPEQPQKQQQAPKQPPKQPQQQKDQPADQKPIQEPQKAKVQTKDEQQKDKKTQTNPKPSPQPAKETPSPSTQETKAAQPTVPQQPTPSPQRGPVSPASPSYRGFGAPYTPYTYGGYPSSRQTMPFPYGAPSMTGRPRYPGMFHPGQVTMPYARTPGIGTPYEGQIQGYDTWGRPVFKPISPYDDKAGTTGTAKPGQKEATSTSQQQIPHSTTPPGSVVDPSNPDAARLLGLEPLYGQLTDPYSEIGMDFSQMYNPYMAKKRFKAWEKQQKFLAKYGQFGAYGMGMNPYGAYGGGFFNGAPNESQLNQQTNGWEEFQESDDNLLGIVQPWKTESAAAEPEMITDQGHQFALLDWGPAEEKPPSALLDESLKTLPAELAAASLQDQGEGEYGDVDDERLPTLESIDRKKQLKKLKKLQKKQQKEQEQQQEQEEQDEYGDEEEEAEQEEEDPELEESSADQEEYYDEEEGEAESEQDEQGEQDEQEEGEAETEQPKSKKKKKDKKKGKHARKGDDYGDISEHFTGYHFPSHSRHDYDDDDEEEGDRRHSSKHRSYHSRRRHYYTGDEDEDHYGYVNEVENDLANALHRGRDKRHKSNKPVAEHSNMEADHHFAPDHHYGSEKQELFAHEHPLYYEDKHHSYDQHSSLHWPVESYDAASHKIFEFGHAGAPHEELDWPEEVKHDEHFYDVSGEQHPADDDFKGWQDHHIASWFDDSHDRAEKHREHQLFGTHYGSHAYDGDLSAMSQLWPEQRAAHETEVLGTEHEGDEWHNVHFDRFYKTEQQSHFGFPPFNEEFDRADSGFDQEFVHELDRDAELMKYHTIADQHADKFNYNKEEAQWYKMYEDPHMHTPYSSNIHDPMRSERSPSDQDFELVNFEQLHSRQPHWTSPMVDHEQDFYHEDVAPQKAKKPTDAKEESPKKKKSSKKASKKTEEPAEKQEKPKKSVSEPQQQDAPKTEDPKHGDSKKNYGFDDYGYEGHHAPRHHLYETEESWEEEEAPVYPYEASIYYDVANGYEIVYDPHYTSPYDDLDDYDDVVSRHRQYELLHYNEAPEKRKHADKKVKRADDPTQFGVPFRRKHDPSPYKPRSAGRRNDLDQNETPMYVRPHLEDPIFLEPDDEDHHQDMNHEYEEVHYNDLDELFESEPELAENGIDNETPMYVRPFLEDPVFLQPDDEEIELLHPDIAQEAEDELAEMGHVLLDSEHHVVAHAALHDLPGDPDLENPDQIEEPEYEEVPEWISEHHLILESAADHIPVRSFNQNGFRHDGEKCMHNFECISNKCVSWLNKAPICMPF